MPVSLPMQKSEPAPVMFNLDHGYVHNDFLASSHVFRHDILGMERPKSGLKMEGWTAITFLSPGHIFDI